MLRLSFPVFLCRAVAAVGLLALPLAQPVLSETVVTPAPAVEAEAVVALDRALRIADLLTVLREEGLEHGATLEADMFPGGGGQVWAEALDRIYDEPAMHARFMEVLGRELADDPALPEILAFFTSDLGVRVVGLEIDARRAFIDDAVEDSARVAADRRRTGRDPRQPLLERFIAAGDLLEANVAGSLTGNLAFLTGLADSGAMGDDLPQDQIMSDVWAQEAQVRDDTESWLHAYLGLAYQPLSDSELDSYIAFWESPAGQRLNAALFVAFDDVFRPVSYGLGYAAGQAILGSDI